jgi:hypothetical protein
MTKVKILVPEKVRNHMYRCGFIIPNFFSRKREIFATKSNIQYCVLVLMKTDPVYKSLKTLPEFNKIMEDQFWDNQAKLKKTLEVEGLL